MKTVLLHLERLRRHYDVAAHTYDHVALLDLSHSLRIWVDLKNSIHTIAPRFLTTLSFKTASPARKSLKAVRGYWYVFSYMPGGVITYVNNGKQMLGDDPNYYDKDGIFQGEVTIDFEFGRREDGAYIVKKFCIANRQLDAHLANAFRSDESVKRCNYIQWLGSDVVRMSYPNSDGILQSVAITREMIVKRMANAFDGSHPSISKDIGNTDNRFDEPIRSLLRHQMMNGLPLPYFILLKIAQDILEIAPKLLESNIPREPRLVEAQSPPR
ncbi:MAG: hypothetical protein Q8S20_21515 [Sulfuritalea sp.]|nr:hypothetical protein [Sulfuritalea sp.]